MKQRDLEACAAAFARWADPNKHRRVLLMSPDPQQTALFRQVLPDASITEWHIQHYNIDSGPPPQPFDLAFAANTFMCAVDPEVWLRNVLGNCAELWLQEPVRAWRDGHRETSPETGDHSRFTFPSRGELSRIPGFDLENSPSAEILDVEFYSDDGANTGEDYKDCRKFVVRLAPRVYEFPSKIVLSEDEFDKLSQKIENPPAPSEKMVEIFKKNRKKKDDSGAP